MVVVVVVVGFVAVVLLEVVGLVVEFGLAIGCNAVSETFHVGCAGLLL